MSKEITGFRPGSDSWKKFMAKLYGIGGAIVIIGALFKLQHYPGSDIMLILGLGTEAIIFFFSAFDPIHKDVDWSLVYPELGEDYEGELSTGHRGGGAGVSTTQELDLMLEQAKIGPDLIDSLGKGMTNLAETATNMNKLGDVAGVTDDLVDTMKSANGRVNELSESYERAAESLTGLSVSNEDGSNYADNLRKVNDNLSSLNNVYELQLQNATEQNQVSAQMFENITDLIQNLNESVQDTKRYKENIAELSNNLESLNTVYGNMLTAMSYRPQGEQA